jgi:hypothetical protein
VYSSEQIRRVKGLSKNLEFVALRTGFFQQRAGCLLSRNQENLANWQEPAYLERSFDAIQGAHHNIAN